MRISADADPELRYTSNLNHMLHVEMVNTNVLLSNIKEEERNIAIANLLLPINIPFRGWLVNVPALPHNIVNRMEVFSQVTI